MVRIVCLILIVSVACPLCGCVESINAEPTAQVSVEERRFDDLIRNYPDMTYRQLADEAPNREYVNKLSFDPAEAKYYDETVQRLQLNDSERELLRKNGFVSIDHGQRYSFGSLYFAVYSNDLPVLITTDSILHAMHSTYDDILMEIEQTLFTDALGEVSRRARQLSVELGYDCSELSRRGSLSHSCPKSAPRRRRSGWEENPSGIGCLGRQRASRFEVGAGSGSLADTRVHPLAETANGATGGQHIDLWRRACDRLLSVSAAWSLFEDSPVVALLSHDDVARPARHGMEPAATRSAVGNRQRHPA